MALLLDTHALIWWFDGDPSLTPAARRAIGNSDEQVVVSLASIWEIAIRHGLGKMVATPQQMLDEIARRNFVQLEIAPEHILQTGQLEHHHRDPFDRLLIAQAQVERLTIVTHDDAFRPYGVPIIWT